MRSEAAIRSEAQAYARRPLIRSSGVSSTPLDDVLCGKGLALGPGRLPCRKPLGIEPVVDAVDLAAFRVRERYVNDLSEGGRDGCSASSANPSCLGLLLCAATPGVAETGGRKGAHLDGRGRVARERNCACSSALRATLPRCSPNAEGEPWGKAPWFPSLGASAPGGCWKLTEGEMGRGIEEMARDTPLLMARCEGRGIAPTRCRSASLATVSRGPLRAEQEGGDPKVPATVSPRRRTSQRLRTAG